MLNVTVVCVAGGQFAFQVDADTRAWQLKDEIEDCLTIPGSCQRLICGTTTLDDNDYLKAYCEGSAEPLLLIVTLIITLDGVVEALAQQAEAEDEDLDCSDGVNLVRSRAFDDLRTLGKKGGVVARNLVLQYLASEDVESKQNAVRCLPALCDKGDQEAATALGQCFQHAGGHLKRVALAVFPEIVDSGDQWAVAAVADLIEREDIDETKEIALRTLAKIANREDELAIVTLCSCILHSSSGVVSAAIEGLVLISPSNARSQISASGCLDDIAVCDTAFEAILKVCSAAQAREEAKSRIGLGPSSVRRAALRAIEHVGKGDEECIALVSAYLLDVAADGVVREAAVYAFAAIADRSDPELIRQLLFVLYDTCAAVRQAGLKALAKCAPRGDATIVFKVTTLLREESNHILRNTALWVLSEIAVRGDEWCRLVLQSFLQSKHTDYKNQRGKQQSLGDEMEAAGQALSQIAPVGDQESIGLLANVLEVMPPHRRRTFIDAIEWLQDGNGPPVFGANWQIRLKLHNTYCKAS